MSINTPDLKFVLGQLMVMRAQLDMTIAMLEGPQPDGCQHPEEKRLDITTGGGGPPRFFCQVCEQELEGQA